MTTKSTNPVTRETNAYVRDKGLRALVVTVHGSLLELRPKGLRSRDTVDLASVYERAVRDRVLFERNEKRKARKGGRKKT